MNPDNVALTLSGAVAVTSRLSRLWCWLVVATAHSILLAALALWLWAARVQPDAALTLLNAILHSKGVAIWFLVFGGSVLGAWLWLMRALVQVLHSKLVGPRVLEALGISR